MIDSRGIVLLLVASVPVTANAQTTIEENRLQLRATASLDRPQVALSGVLLLTLRVEGPSVLEVEVPPLLLTPASLQLWKVQPVDSPMLTDLGMGRQRWQRDYRVDPYVPGKTVGMNLAPMKVRFGSGQEVLITWMKSLVVEVTKSVEQTDPSMLHSITGVEEPPANSDPGAPRRWLFMAIVVACTIVTMLIVALLIWRQIPPPAPVIFDAQWSLGELQILATSSERDTNRFDHLARILRRYLQTQLSLASERLSTPELINALSRSGTINPDAIGHTHAILERCDVAKFAASTDRTESADVRDWIDRAKQLITQIEVQRVAEAIKSAAS